MFSITLIFLFRPRAMDGSADLKWRLYQSRRGTSGSGRGRNLPGFSGGYNSNIPYNSWSSATDIRVPRYADCTHFQMISSPIFFYKNHDKNSPPGHAIIVQLSCYLSGISMTEDPTWRAQSLLSVGGWSTSIVSRWVEMFMFDDHNWPDILCPRTGTIRVAAWPTGGSLSPTMWSIAGWPGTDHHGWLSSRWQIYKFDWQRGQSNISDISRISFLSRTY